MQRFALALAAPLVLLVAACGKTNATANNHSPMTQIQTIATRPLCVGRFLIDVPADAQVVGTQTNTSSTAGTVSVKKPISRAAFQSKMNDIQMQLKSAVHQTEGSRLAEVTRPDDSTYIFRYRKSGVGARVFQIDGYRWNDSAIFGINSNASNDSFQTVVKDVSMGLNTVQFRDPWVTPSEPGFCFDHGFLPGKESSFEATGVSIKSAQLPGVTVFLETRLQVPSPVVQPSLIVRTKEALKLNEGGNKPAIVRERQDRVLLFGQADEVLLKQRHNKHYSLLGDVEMKGRAGALDKPDVAFSLVLDPPKNDTDQPAEAAVLQLWDSVVNSLRLRPGAL
jgi:hypothetical protein